jgi:hypothetical protein
MNILMVGTRTNRLSSPHEAAPDWWWGTDCGHSNGHRRWDRGETNRTCNEWLWNDRDLVDLVEFESAPSRMRGAKDISSTAEKQTPRLSLVRGVRFDTPMGLRGRSPGYWTRSVQPAALAMIARVETTIGRLIAWWNNRGSFRRRSNPRRRSDLTPRSPGSRQAKTRPWPGRSPDPRPTTGR